MHCDKHNIKMILEHAQMLSTVYRMSVGELMQVRVKQNDGTYKTKEWYAVDSDTIKIRKNSIPELIDYCIYAPTHINHPCTVWVRKSLSNYNWLVQMTKHLNDEYKYRFNHTENHKSWDMISDYLLEIDNLSDFGLTKPALAMDDEYKISSGFNISQTKAIIKRKESVLLVIKSYRNYYAKAKANLLTYTKRDKPKWLEEY
jgi:hypothetical protein